MLRIGGPRRKSITSNGLSGSLEEPSLAAIIGLTYRSGPFISARSTPRSRSCGTAFGKVGSLQTFSAMQNVPKLNRFCRLRFRATSQVVWTNFDPSGV